MGTVGMLIGGGDACCLSPPPMLIAILENFCSILWYKQLAIQYPEEL
jgi:hypothetical protein